MITGEAFSSFEFASLFSPCREGVARSYAVKITSTRIPGYAATMYAGQSTCVVMTRHRAVRCDEEVEALELIGTWVQHKPTLKPL